VFATRQARFLLRVGVCSDVVRLYACLNAREPLCYYSL
jgi:hypothetical protein